MNAHHSLLLLMCISLVGSGCDELRLLVEPSNLEDRLREDPDRPGKVGSIVGVAVYQKARHAASQIATRPAPECAIDVAPSETWLMELRLQRIRGGETTAFWDEERRFTRDADGDLEVRLSANFQTRIGERDTRQMAWRVVGDRSYLAESGADGLRWYERSGGEDERARVLSAGPGAFQALLDAVDGWSKSGPSSWERGEERLRCSAQDEGLAFVDRFVASATLQSATFEVDDRVWNLQAEWRLTDQTRVKATTTARLQPAQADLSPPQTLVDVSRERSYARSQALLEKLASDGIVELTSPEEESKDEETATP